MIFRWRVTKKIFLLSLLFLIEGLCLGASQIKFDIYVDKKKVAIGDTLRLNLVFEGTQNISPPRIGEIEGFRTQYIGPSTRVSIINGKVNSSISFVYLLFPLKKGTFTIGPFSLTYKGHTYTSGQVRVEVVDKTFSQNSSPEPKGSEKIFLVIEPQKNKVYVNELFNLKLKLYINQFLNVRNIQYPEISHQAFSSGEFKNPRQYKDIVGGSYYNVVEFELPVFPVKSGKLSLGPAKLKCEALKRRKKRHLPSFGDFDNFFDDSFFEDFFQTVVPYPLELQAPAVPITVLELPSQGKPPDFSGGVGEFNMEAEVSPLKVKVGDPITLRVTVKGEGNFDTVKPPVLNLKEEDFKVYEPQIEFKGKSKKFEYVIIPLHKGIKEIPQVRFSFFDPSKKIYVTEKRGPFKIEISEPRKKEELKIVEMQPGKKKVFSQKLGRDIVYIKEEPGKLYLRGSPFYKNKFFLFLQILPLLIFLGGLRIRRQILKIKSDSAYADKLKAPRVAKAGLRELERLLREEKPQEFYEGLFKTLQRYLGYKLHLPWRGITVEIVEMLEAKKIEPGILEKVREIFSECDIVRFAPLEFDKDRMKRSLEALKEIIDYLERRLR